VPPVAAAVLPHPPLLVPELAGGAAAELDPLRSACRAALSTVLAAADLTVLVGDGPVWGVPEPGAPGSFRPYGADVEVELPGPVALDLAGLPEPVRLTTLPLSLAVAALLLADLDPAPASLFAATVPASLGPGAAASIGRTLAASAQRHASDPGAGRPGAVGVVAMGDLSACRSERAPGAFRAEAAGFDAAVGEAVRAGEPGRLLDLDPGQAVELLVAGRVPLQVLAGALGDGVEGAARSGARGRPPPAMRGQVLYEDAPYGVGYLVALLTAHDRPPMTGP
jgi:hypothetical protein